MSTYNLPLIHEIGNSEIFLNLQDRIAAAAVINRPVLLIGERGTGKELAARRLHYMSKRWEGPLVTVNCAALPQSLLESELFGYEKGAFTGALSTRKGRFEEAEGGTLFLDEIGLIPLQVQEKLLRIVEYGTFERLGSSETRNCNVRIIGATNADLKQMSLEGRFKTDLLDRLSFEVIFVPPLRLRGNDIMLLARNFAVHMSEECGIEHIPEFTERAQSQLLSYSWPGNVRELKNTVERAVYRSTDGVIDEICIDPFLNPYEPVTSERCLSECGLSDHSSSECSPSERSLSEHSLSECSSSKHSPSECSSSERSSSGSLSESDPQSGFDNYELSQLEKAHTDLDISFLKRALSLSGGSQSKAAQEMNLSYDKFRSLYRKYKDQLSH